MFTVTFLFSFSLNIHLLYPRRVLADFHLFLFIRYKSSEESRIKNEMSTASLKKAVDTAEKQLQRLSHGKFDMSFEQLQ